MRAVGIIPCRLASTRLPGKVLMDIHGKPMLWHVYERARRAETLASVHVASGDEQIIKAAQALGLPTIRTSGRHGTGTDCVAECRSELPADIYVNVQGDEPMLDSSDIDKTVKALIECDAAATNACSDIIDISDALNVNIVKVVMTGLGYAMMYSRFPIPYPKSESMGYVRQIGLYAFRPWALDTFVGKEPSLIERAEDVEMLRLLEARLSVLMVRVGSGSVPVDTMDDLKHVRDLMAR